jgi:hypothetical protein
MTTKPLLKKILKGIIHIEDENKHSYEMMEIINPQEKSIQAIRE